MKPVRIIISTVHDAGTQKINISSLGGAVFTEKKTDGTVMRKLRAAVKPYEFESLASQLLSSDVQEGTLWKAEILFEDGVTETVSSSAASADLSSDLRDMLPIERLWAFE